MRAGRILTAAALGLALLATGCSQAVKEGFGLARGAKGTLTVLEQASGASDIRALGGYQRFEIGQIADDMNGQVPNDLFRFLPEAFDKMLAAKKIPNASSGKTLLVRGKVLHYEDTNVVGVALGPLEFVVARMEFVDKATGNVLGTANCVGRTTERVNLGVAKKAEGLAKAIVAWIDARYPQDQRQK